MILFKDKYRTDSIRLAKYDYAQMGLYFITIITHNRGCIFGNIKNNIMILNDLGKIAEKCWRGIPFHFPNASLLEFIIMPNHIHGIIALSVETSRFIGAVSLRSKSEHFGKPTRQSIPTIIRSFKSATTKMTNEYRNFNRQPVWQSGYYEHIIRNEDELNRIREYILTNPQNWLKDAYTE
ncbi:MAG: transposase [Candidatus Marinimicrobia bacterium]|nr:transposase [Candidatus Neomarinimicrobiota bacterium]